MIKVVIFLIVIYIVFQAAYSIYYLNKSAEVVKKTHTGTFNLGEKSKPSYLIWADGDSVGAGVGASSFKTSLVGRIGEHIADDNNVTLNNKSISGLRMKQLVEHTLPDKKQDLIVLVISSNDLFHFSNLKDFKVSTEKVLARYSPLGEKLIIIGPGRIFDADAVPVILKPVYRLIASKYSDVISQEAKKYKNVIYINPTSVKSAREYGFTGASDHFHPNDAGYEFWFDLVRPHL